MDDQENTTSATPEKATEVPAASGVETLPPGSGAAPSGVATPAQANGEDVDKKLAELQAELEIYKKRKVMQDARKKDQDTIASQRASSQAVLDDANKSYAKWKTEIEMHVGAPARTILDTKIKAVDDEVLQAQTKLDNLKQTLSTNDTQFIAATTNLADLEAQYASKQKQLNQLPTRIKEIQTRIEKLRAETKGAIDAKHWNRAYYKNFRFQQALADAVALLNANQNGDEAKVLTKLKNLEEMIVTAQTAIKTAKDQLESNKVLLKSAEDELKRKLADQETAIDTFL